MLKHCLTSRSPAFTFLLPKSICSNSSSIKMCQKYQKFNESECRMTHFRIIYNILHHWIVIVNYHCVVVVKVGAFLTNLNIDGSTLILTNTS